MEAKITESKNKTQEKKKQEALQKYLRTVLLTYYKHTTIGASVLIVLCGYFFVIGPKISTAQDVAQTRLESLVEEQGTLEYRLSYLAQVQADRSTVFEGDINRIHDALPSYPATAELITSIEAIAQESNVIVEGIELAIIDPNDFTGIDSGGIHAVPGGARVVEANLGVTTGPYTSVKQFLDKIEKSLRLLDVIAISYSPIGKTYNIIVRAYFFPE